MKKKYLIFTVLIILISAGVSLLGIKYEKTQIDFIGYLHEIIAAGIGFFIFFYGFKQLRKKMLIENTPTSKIRSAAMGLCELTGLAKQKFVLKSPITFADCVLYKFLIQKEVKDSKGRRHWSTVSSGVSSSYFYIEDATGKILVDPLDAEFILVKDYEYIETKGFTRMKYTEWYIKPGDYVYILGTVGKFKDDIVDKKEKLNERLRALKNNKDKLSLIDTNKDGQISVEEWDMAREKIEQEIFEEELKNLKSDTDDIVIAKGSSENIFIISDRDEKEVTRKLFIKGVLISFSGFILIIIVLTSLLARIGFLTWNCAIPWERFYKGG